MRYAGKIFASLSAASIVADPITDFRSASAIGGIPLQDSSLLGGSAPATVDISNFITNYFNGEIASGISTPNVMINYNDLVGGTDPNSIAGVGASFASFNPLVY